MLINYTVFIEVWWYYSFITFNIISLNDFTPFYFNGGRHKNVKYHLNA